MRLSKYHLAVLALIATNIIWGASSPIFKWALTEIPPFTFAFIRFLLSALILLPFTLHKLKIDKKDFPKLAILAFFGFFLHIGLLLFGLTLTASINAPIIASSAPIFLLIGSAVFLKEKIKSRTLYGTIISLFGVIIIILRPLIEQGLEASIIGNILLVIATTAFVIYTILLKEYNFRYNALTLTFWLFAITAFIYFPFFLWESAGSEIGATLHMKALIGILFGAIFTSVLGYVFYNFAVKKIPASETGIFLYIDPIVTIMVALPLLGEEITPPFIFGSILVFLGIFIAENRIHYHPIHKLRHQPPA
jgi:drug/metabolite transporter (DMT)-like permease